MSVHKWHDITSATDVPYWEIYANVTPWDHTHTHRDAMHNLLNMIHKVKTLV